MRPTPRAESAHLQDWPYKQHTASPVSALLRVLVPLLAWGIALRLQPVYIYGYLNRVQSSRRLEREAQRNVELRWLTQRLMPDFKTIANFRKDNGKAILPTVRRPVSATGSVRRRGRCD